MATFQERSMIVVEEEGAVSGRTIESDRGPIIRVAVTAHFPGGQMIFDVVHPVILKRVGSNVGGTGATYQWSLDDPQDIKQLEPKLELIKEFRPSEQVAFSRFPLWWRAQYRLMEFNSTLRRMNRTVVY
jgi:hypothetical protein